MNILSISHNDLDGFGCQFCRISLRIEDVQGIAGEERREQAIKDSSRKTCKWLEEAPGRKQRVTSVWMALIGPHGVLKEELLGPGCENNESKVKEVRKAIESWSDRSAVADRFEALNKKSGQGKSQKIYGAGKQDLLREVGRAVQLAEQWSRLIEQKQNISQNKDWYQDLVI